mgnify:CR=1 FL=1
MGNALDACSGEKGPESESDRQKKAITIREHGDDSVSQVGNEAKEKLRARAREMAGKHATADDLKKAFRDSLAPRRKKSYVRAEEDIREEKEFISKLKVKIDGMVDVGYKLWGEKKFDSAQREFERTRDESLRALHILKEMNRPPEGRWFEAVQLLKGYLARAYGNLARCLEARNDNEGAIKNYYPCLKLVKQLNDIDAMCKVYNNVAVSYLTMGELNRSLHFHEKTLDLYKKTNRDTEALEKRIKFIKDRRVADSTINSLQESIRLEEEEKVNGALDASF